MLPKLERFQPKLITETFFPDYVNKPEDINYGLCWEWAWLAHKTFKNVELWDICAHAFVRHRNKFYDSQRLLGEEDWKDLPASNFGMSYYLEPCGTCLTHPGRVDGNIEASPLTESQFKLHWGSQTKRFNMSWAQLDKLAQQELRRHAHHR